MSLTLRQLVTELEERSRDPSTLIKIQGFGDIEDIEITNDGFILLIGEEQNDIISQ